MGSYYNTPNFLSLLSLGCMRFFQKTYPKIFTLDACKAPEHLGPLPNAVAHERPVVGRKYGHKFGSKTVKAIRTEEGCLVVDYIDGKGVPQTESLTLFNRWLFRIRNRDRAA